MAEGLPNKVALGRKRPGGPVFWWGGWGHQREGRGEEASGERGCCARWPPGMTLGQHGAQGPPPRTAVWVGGGGLNPPITVTGTVLFPVPVEEQGVLGGSGRGE